MKKMIGNKRFNLALAALMSLLVCLFSVAVPAKSIYGTGVAIAAESSADKEKGEEISEEANSGETLPELSEESAKDNAKDDAEEEKLSFTERVAAKFATSLGKYIPAELVVVFVSMLPILELRAGLFVAKFLNLPLLKAIPLCILGNIIPIPLILLFIKKIFKWLGKTKLFHGLVEKLEARAMKKSTAISNGEFVGLMLFVGIPIPGTGAWMGSLIAALLEIDFKKAIAAELVGIAIATVIVSILSYGLLGIII